MSNHIKSNRDLVKEINGVFQWNVTKNGKIAGQWIVDLKTGYGSVIQGTSSKAKPDCVITLDDDDLIGIASGKANPQQLFMKRKLNVKGNIMLTMKLDKLFKERSKI